MAVAFPDIFDQGAVGTASGFLIEGSRPASIRFGHGDVAPGTSRALAGVFGGGSAPKHNPKAAKPADLSLTQALFPLGLVTGLSINYNETYTDSAPRIESFSALQLGVAVVTGVIFNSVCPGTNKNSSSVSPDIHGLECILEFYSINRISNRHVGNMNVTGDPFMSTLLIGTTSIDGWVVGLDIQPQNFDYRIWQWQLKLAITPQYQPYGKGP